ncbi:restriction endonuclease subunit S [Cereibacter sphaeroides]|uniref:restriction endonuclease subunit S n=1 Tax=Cereibacter sphaeroides TaxID=1063 RepID=UPI001F163748|nr:restriction endonuclease subunit S [Cereibacter sphaeroides]MCE6949536.1 restriction endonuclease subunit S [Cereibacter sphaeroides]
MRRYPAYKDSGVEWLGEVPEGWEVVLSRRLFRQTRDDALNDDEQLSATQKSGVIPQRIFMEQEDQKVVLALSGTSNFKHVEAGDFVISLRSFQGGIEYSAHTGCVSPAYTVLRAIKKLDSAYFRFLLKSDAYISVLQSVTSGIRDGRNVSYDQFGNIGVPLPPLPEQRAIAAFLDRETAKIDALVEEQRRLIALLAEKRQAVISHAVTRGLNPDAPLKPSGIDWLGDIPEAWEMRELKHLVAEGTTITYGIVQAGPEYEGGIPYIRTSDMSGKQLPVSGFPLTSPEIECAYVRSRVFPGDIVIAIRATIGKALPVPDELAMANLTQGTAKISPGRNCCRDFLLFALASPCAQIYFDLMAKGATFREITLDALRRLPVPVPTLEEQRRIAAFLTSETAKLDTLTDIATTAIALLQERRAALISAAVTGKIDVRDLSPQSISECLEPA